MAKSKNPTKQNKMPINDKMQGSQISNPSEKSSFLSSTLLYCILIVFVLLAFGSGFSNGFVYWDDPLYVLDNQLIQIPSFSNLIKLLTVECALNYHPLTLASFWLNSALFGKEAPSFIVINVLIHLINTILVFRFSQLLTKKNILISFLIALFWGIHPMHVESVIWISERKDVLYTMFFFIACIQYVKYLENNEQKRIVYCFVFFVLSCLSKGMAVVLPVVLLLIDYWFGKGFLTAKNILPKIPFFITALLFGVLAIHIQGGGDLGGRIEKMSMDVALGNTYTIIERFKFGFYGFLVYLYKFFIPINQHNFYGYPDKDNSNNFIYVISPIVSLLIIGGILFSYHKKKVLFFGGIFFCFTIFLVLQFITVGQAIVSERYTYIPYFGILFSVFCWLDELIERKKLILFGGMVVAMIFTYLTHKQTLVYKNTETLFLNSYQYEPKSLVVNEAITNNYGRIGDLDGVIKYGEIALTNGLNSPMIGLALGNAHSLKGDFQKSFEFFQKAIDSSPENQKLLLYKNRAFAYARAGLFNEAAKDYTKVLELDKANSATYLALRANTYLKANKFKEANADYNYIITNNLATDTTYNSRAVVRFNLGNRDGAIEDLKMALKLNPNYGEARSNLEKLGL
jgi:protein O-mannosyl-transferase